MCNPDGYSCRLGQGKSFPQDFTPDLGRAPPSPPIELDRFRRQAFHRLNQDGEPFDVHGVPDG